MQIDSPVIAKLAILDTYSKDASQPPSYALTSCLTSSSASLDLWHCCLGHLHTRAITRMVDNNLVTGMDISNCDPPASLCEPCLEGKQTWDTISKVTSMCAEHVLSRMFTDMCRPLPTTFHRGFRYFITFVDDSSCYTSVSPL